MLKICNKLASEFFKTFHGKKSVCLKFHLGNIFNSKIDCSTDSNTKCYMFILDNLIMYVENLDIYSLILLVIYFNKYFFFIFMEIKLARSFQMLYTMA